MKTIAVNVQSNLGDAKALAEDEAKYQASGGWCRITCSEQIPKWVCRIVHQNL
jgi:hypothetical protein